METTGAAAPPPTTLLGRLDRTYAHLEDGLNWIAAAAIFALMFIGVFQIVARTLFGTAIYGYIDYIEQASAIYAFLGIAYCQRLGGHIRMDIALRLLPERATWVLEAAAVLAALAITGLLVESSFQNFLRAWTLGDSTMDIRLPVWPSKLVVPFALAVLWLRLALQLAGYLRLVLRPGALPEAVPVVRSLDAQAQDEIDDALGRIKNGNA